MNPEYALPEELTIHQIGEVHQLFKAALQQDGARFVLSDIIELDTSAAQLMYWAQREGARLRRPISFVNPNPLVCRYLALIGLDGQLQFEQEDTAA